MKKNSHLRIVHKGVNMVNETANSETVGMFQIEEVISRPKRNEKKKSSLPLLLS